jgi:hypothetical protein
MGYVKYPYVWGCIVGIRKSWISSYNEGLRCPNATGIVQPLGKQGMCDAVTLPFTLKSILRQKKSYGNPNISPCKNYN